MPGGGARAVPPYPPAPSTSEVPPWASALPPPHTHTQTQGPCGQEKPPSCPSWALEREELSKRCGVKGGEREGRRKLAGGGDCPAVSRPLSRAASRRGHSVGPEVQCDSVAHGPAAQSRPRPLVGPSWAQLGDAPGPPPARPQPWSASGPGALQGEDLPLPAPPRPRPEPDGAQGEGAAACEHLHPRRKVREWGASACRLHHPPGCWPPSAPRPGSRGGRGRRPAGGFVTGWQQAR